MATLLISLILALVAVAFSLQNTEAVTIRFLIWEYQTSLVLVILGALAIGAILAQIASIGPRIRRARQVHQLQETVAAQGTRIHSLEAQLQQAPAATKESSSFLSEL